MIESCGAVTAPPAFLRHRCPCESRPPFPGDRGGTRLWEPLACTTRQLSEIHPNSSPRVGLL